MSHTKLHVSDDSQEAPLRGLPIAVFGRIGRAGPLRSPRVLFASPAGREPGDALRRARAMCDVVEADLVVLRLVALADEAPVSSRRRARLSSEDEVMRGTLRWCKAVLQDELPEATAVWSGGDLVSAIVSANRALGASFIVIPHTRNGALVRRVVHETRLPLLVARRPRGTRAVVAATDFSDARYPVLREALRVACGLVAPAVFVHNVGLAPGEALSAPMVFGGRLSLGDLPVPFTSFDLADRAFGTRCARVVLSTSNTVEAILEVSRSKGADLIVVGTHVTSRGKHAADRPSVAAQVVERADGSVLVVPVGDPDSAS